MIKREDDFSQRRAHLANLSDDELKSRFWALTEQLFDPLLALAAKAMGDGCMARGLLGHGAGNVVYRYAKQNNLQIRDAGLALLNPAKLDEAAKLFGGVQ